MGHSEFCIIDVDYVSRSDILLHATCQNKNSLSLIPNLKFNIIHVENDDAIVF